MVVSTAEPWELPLILYTRSSVRVGACQGTNTNISVEAPGLGDDHLFGEDNRLEVRHNVVLETAGHGVNLDVIFAVELALRSRMLSPFMYSLITVTASSLK